MKSFSVKHFYLTLFFLVLFIVMHPGTSDASVNIIRGQYFEARHVGIILDDFMLKQKFSIPKNNNGMPRYTVEKQNETNDGKIVYTFSQAPGLSGKEGLSLDVTVDKKTNTIIGLNLIRFEAPYSYSEFTGEWGGPKNMNSLNVWYDSWLQVVASRYGNPTEPGTSQTGYPYAKFKEEGKYKYLVKAFFDNGRGGENVRASGPSTFLIEIKAI